MSQITKGTLYLSLASMGYMISGYITNVWLGRHLGPELYGLYGVIIGLITAANIIQTSGLPQATSKYIAESENNSEAVLRTSLGLQLISTFIISLIVLLLAQPVANFLHDVRLVSYLRLSALIFPVYGLFAIYIGYYNGLHNFRKQAFLGIIYSSAKVVAVIGLAIYWQLYGVVLGFVIAPLIALFLSVHLPKATASISARKLISFSVPLTIFALLSTLQITIDLFFVKAILPNKYAGYYVASQSISLLPYVGLSAISGVLFPQVSKRIGRGEYEKLRKIIFGSFRYVLIVLIPVTALISATSPTLIRLLYGRAFLPASSSLSILIFGYALLTIFLILANVLNGAGEGIRSWVYAGVGILTAIVGYTVLIGPYGLSGAAISTTIGALISCSLAVRTIWSHFKLTIPFSTMLRVAGAGGIIYTLAHFIHPSTLLLIPMYIALFILYIGVLILAREFNDEDRRQIRDLLPTWLLSIRWF